MFDVAVVGAGPSGSMVSTLLARQGWNVVLLEEHLQPGDPVNCSGIIGVEAFQRFDLPRADILREIQSFRFYSPNGSRLDYSHPEPLAYAVNRSSFDIRLAAKAVDAGAQLMTGLRVNTIGVGDDGVTLSVFRDSTTVKSKFVVIATGAGSKLTQLAGLGTPKRCLIGAQTECLMTESDHVEIHLGNQIANSNFGWVIPLRNGKAKIGLICEGNASAALKNFLTRLSLERRLTYDPGTIQCSLLPLETIPKSYRDRLLVVGEAAGQIKTITCGGIYYGLLAAEIAAQVLDVSLQQNRFDANALSVYEVGWRKLLERELKMGIKLRSFFGKLADVKIDSLFDLARRDGIMDLIRQKANFDWHYDLVSAIFRHSLVSAFLQPIAYSKLFC